MCVPDVKRSIEDVGLFQTIKLNLAVTHLVVHALQLIVQLQLLPFKLAVLLLVPFSTKRWIHTELLMAVSFSTEHCHLFTSSSGGTHCSSSVSSCWEWILLWVRSWATAALCSSTVSNSWTRASSSSFNCCSSASSVSSSSTCRWDSSSRHCLKR